MFEKEKSAKFIIAFLFILITISVLYALRIVFMPIILAFFMAYLLNPVVGMLEKKNVNRTFASFYVLMLLLIASFLLFSSLLSVVQKEISLASEKLPSYISTFANTILPKLKKIFMLRNLPSTLDEFFVQIGNYASHLPPDVMSEIAGWIHSLFKNTFSYIIGLFGIIIMPFYVFYLIRDFEKIKASAYSYLPLNHRHWFDVKWAEIDSILNSFLRRQLILCVIMIGLYSSSLYLIGIEFSFVIGLISGVAFIVPFMGLVIGILLGGTMALLQFQDILHPTLVIISFAILQIVEAYVITPKLIGRKVGLHPVITIVSIMVWGELLGLFGILIALPLTAVLKVFLKSLADNFRSSPLFNR